MSTFQDEEFGAVTVHRNANSRSVRLSIAPSGTLRISMPRYAPLFLAKRLLEKSRSSIRTQRMTTQPDLHDNMTIGKSHTLRIRSGTTLDCIRRGQTILLTLPPGISPSDTTTVTALTPIIIAALKREAKSYLPRRLAYLAEAHGFTYSSVRFSHASTRWGSCSSSGTISLNIALMKLDFELIDYVLLHELSHTRHMNHSKSFWSEVARCDPSYQEHRRILKKHQPHVF